MKLKLNVLLAKTDHLASSWKKAIADYIKFFKNDQGQFKGQLKTYAPNPGTIDIPTRRGNTRVVTTVDEKLNWLEETFSPYLDALFSQEKTNSEGVAKAKLIVDGTDFGLLSTLELLKLKSLIEHGDIENMYGSIPVRPEDEKWTVSTNEEHKDRKLIWQSEEISGAERTGEKESYILSDPNIKQGMAYTPQVAHKTVITELGKWSHQKFSGEWSHRQRAELLRRRTKLLTAVIEALKEANDVEIIESSITGKKIFQYLHDIK